MMAKSKAEATMKPTALGIVLIVFGLVFIAACTDQRRHVGTTMADVRIIATACESYRVDHNSYPEAASIAEVEPFLVPTYLRVLPKRDAWGNGLTFRSTGTQIIIASPGRDGDLHKGPFRGPVNDANARVVFLNGDWVEWPKLEGVGWHPPVKGNVMMIGLFWALLGALIGIAAAQKRGFSMIGGLLGGFLLGPLAVLMFAVNGVATGGERKKCPFCAEWIKAEAIVCPHCQRDLAQAFNVFCPACGKGFNVSPAALGHVARCPHCKKMVPTKKPADIQQRKEGAP
jgi:hypothetical protein